MNVLSLFDGISCGQVALERAGIKVDNYYASEIDKYTIQVTMKNYPNTIQLGDVEKWEGWELPKIDLVIGGSPCQDLSAYKLNKNDAKGLEGSKSILFYHYEKVIKGIKPKYFLLENVPMDKRWENIITDVLGVRPTVLNSNIVAACDRKRVYWTNVPFISEIEDKGILIRDIIEKPQDVPDKYWYDLPFIYHGVAAKVQCTLDVERGFQRNMKEVYNVNNKCNTLLADGDGGNRQKKVYQDGRCRKFTPLEYERMQTLPDNYTDCLSDSRRYSAIGNGWTVDVIAHIFKGLKEEVTL